MIAGVGLDMVDVAAFARQLQDPASQFATGVFTAAELAAAERTGSRDAHLAVRWAAKEAFVKAWASQRRGQPPQLDHLDWRQMEVAQDPFGRPTLILHGLVAQLCGRPRLHLSLCHEGPMAAAVLIWENEP